MTFPRTSPNGTKVTLQEKFADNGDPGGMRGDDKKFLCDLGRQGNAGTPFGTNDGYDNYQ